MSTNPQSPQYRTEPTPTEPTPTMRRPASRTAPRTFEPTQTGELPPMFETEATLQER